MSILDGKFYAVGWLGNPLFLLTTVLLLKRQYRQATIAGLAAIGFAACSLTIKSVLMNEAGHEAEILQYGLGFYLWMTAIITQTALAALGLFRSNSFGAGLPTPPKLRPQVSSSIVSSAA